MLRLENIQGNFIRGYTHPFGAIRFVEVTQADAARTWLGKLLPHVTSEKPWESKPTTTLNLMFTWKGLQSLGLPAKVLDAFPEDFRQGMAARSDVLGDTGEDAPEHWSDGLGSGRIHIAVSIYALQQEHLDNRLSWLDNLTNETGGIVSVSELPVNRLIREGPNGNRHYPEHFGYADGLGQPALAGTPVQAPPGQGAPEADGKWRDLALGDYLLGYENEDEEWASTGIPEALWRDGTYAVYRKIYQNVAAFRRLLKEQGAQYPGGEDLLAAKIVGRWPDGSPIALCPLNADPKVAWDDSRNNDFRYADDPEGFRCPVGAHIRRANPRDSLPFGASMVNSHRIIRRGVPYGPLLPEGQLEDDNEDRGLLFIAYQTNINRQFEFISSLWLSDGNKLGLGDDRDPLLGQGEGSGKMKISGGPPYFVAPLPRLCTVRGGEYFLRPSLTGLAYLADRTNYASGPIATAPPPKPEADGSLLTAIGHDLSAGSKLIAQGLMQALQNAGLQHPHMTEAQFRFLRSYCPTLVLGKLAVVTRYDDVREVLDDGTRFPVAYGPVMEKLAGPGTLGMGDTEEYRRDSEALRAVVRKDDLEHIADFAKQLSERLVGSLQSTGRIDVARDLCNIVPIRVLADYFGTPGVSEELQLTWSHKLFEEIFGNVRDNVSDITPEGLLTAVQWCAYLDDLIAARKKAVHEGKPTHDDLLDRLVRQQGGAGPSLTDEKIRANLIYMTVGFIPQVSKVTVLALDELLNRPHELAGAQRAAQSRDVDGVAKYVWEALRFNAETPGLFRRCAADTVIAKGTKHEARIPGGALVLAATQSASFDGTVIQDPDEFRTDRPWSNYLYFGSGQHTCLGEYVSRTQIPYIAAALLRLPGLRRAKESAGKLSWSGIWPDRMVLEFDPVRP